jgi:hypothetical protein
MTELLDLAQVGATMPAVPSPLDTAESGCAERRSDLTTRRKLLFDDPKCVIQFEYDGTIRIP